MSAHTYTITDTEKLLLRKQHILMKDIRNYSVPDLQSILTVPLKRAREIYGLYEFQSIPSIGIKFAQDLLSIGYYSLADLQHKTGAELIHELEVSTGVWQDPCVEDQCRLVVHYAQHGDAGKQWWHFTNERKIYRAKHGCPADRPVKAWLELLGYPAR